MNDGLAVKLKKVTKFMGQAKLRGDFEQRKAEGITKRELAKNRKLEQIAARKANETPKQRANRRTLAILMAFAGMTANV